MGMQPSATMPGFISPIGQPEPTKAAWRVIRYMKTLIDSGDSEEAVKAKAAKKYPELKSQGWMFKAAMANMQEGETL